MEGIRFTSSLDTDPFVKSANAIISQVKAVAANVERLGGDVSKVFDNMFNGNTMSKGIEAFVDNVIENFKLSEKSAEEAKRKIVSEFQQIAQSGDDAATKASKMVTALHLIASEYKQIDMQNIAPGGVDSKPLEDMRISASTLIDILNETLDVSDQLEQKLSNMKGQSFDEIKKSVDDYGQSLDDSKKAAEDAYKAQEEYIGGIEKELADLTSKINTTSDKTVLTNLNDQATELSIDLNNAKIILKQIGDMSKGIDVKITEYQEVKDTTNAFDELNKKLEQYGRILSGVKIGTEESTKAFEEYANKTNSVSNEIKGTLKSLATMAGIAFGVHEIGNFIQSIAAVREEFQDIESSMKVFLGNEEKATEFVGKLKDYAWYNMFEFKDLTKASQQMIAYGQDVDTIIPKLDMLSNVAAGTHAPLMEMVDAYNRAKSTGVVDAQGVKSWAVKGVVIKDVLKEMGEAASGTQITFEQLNKVLEHITGEGGMFHNLMAEQLNNISAEKGQLEDNLANMFNDIGEKLQGAITKWYKLQSDMVDNYTDIAGGEGTIDFVVNVAETGMDLLMQNWKELMVLIKNAIALYGAWRVAIVATNAVHKLQIALWQAEAAAVNINSGAIKSNTIAKGQATRATVLLDKATKAFNASMLASPWTWAAAGLAAVLYGVYKLVTAETLAAAGVRKANEALQEQSDLLNERKDNINNLINTIKDENQTSYSQLDAYKKLKAIAPEITDAYTQQQLAAMGVDEVMKLLNKDLEDVEYEQAKKEVEEYTKKVEGLKKTIENYQNSPTQQMSDRTGAVYSSYLKSLEEAENYLNTIRNRLNEMENTRREASTPIEIKIKESEENYNQKKKILDFYNEAMTLAQAVEDADDEMSTQVGRNNETNYEVALDAFNAFYKKVEEDLANPFTLKYGNDKEETARFLKELEDLRSTWQGVFASPIDVTFRMKFTQAQQAVENALGNAPEGYHWVKDDSFMGGHLEADTKQAVVRNKEEIQKELKQVQDKIDAMSVAEAKADKLQKNGQAARRKQLQEELKAYSDSSKEGAKLSKQRAERRAKEIQEQQKHNDEMLNLKKESDRAIEDASIAAIINNSVRERAERETQHKRKIADIKAQEDDIYKTIYEQRKKQYEIEHKNDKDGGHYENDNQGSKGWRGVKGTLTEEEQKYFNEREKIIQANLQKEEAEWGRYESNRIKEQAQSMREYLTQYGTFQQQRLALTEEYAEKIAEAEAAGNEWDAKKLSAERDTKIAQANAQSLAMNIDWNQTFSGIGNVLQDIAKETLREVNSYMQTAEFKALGAEAKKAYQDLKQQLLEAGGQEASNPFSSKTWDEIASLTKSYQMHVKELEAAQKLNKKAVDEKIKADDREKKAREKLADLLEKQKITKIEGNDTTEIDKAVDQAKTELADASQDVSEALEEVKNTSEAVADQQANVTNTQQQVHQRTEAAAQGLKNFNTVLGQLTSGTLSGFVEGVSNVINALTKDTSDDMKGLIGMIGEKAGGIIGAILSIIDMLGDTPVEFFDSLLTGISKVVEAVISNIPQIIMSIVKGAGNIVASIGKGILGIFGDFFGADNHEEMLELQDKYTRAIDSTTHSLEKFTEELEKSYGIMAVQNSKEAENLIRQNMNTILKGIDSALNDNYGGGHSDYWHLNKSQSVLEQILGYGSQYGVNAWNGSKLTWNELLSLNSSESLAKTFKDIRDKDSDLWRVITSELGYNEGALKEWLEKLIDTYDQIEENQKKLNEQLTTTTEENVFDDFLDSLYSLADGSEDVTEEIAKNWQQMVNKMVINNLVIEKFRGRLTEWYADLVKANDELANGGINETEYQSRIDALGESYNNILSDAQNEIDTFTEMGLIKPIEDATEEGEKAFQDMTSSWVSSLMDFNATAEDWAQNLGQTIAQKIIEEMVVPTLIQPLLDNLQAAFDKAMEENTFTESSGKKAYYWMRVLDNDGLKAAIADINRAYPELKETIHGIMSMAGVEEGFSNSLDSLGDTLIDRLLTLDEDAEDIGKQIGSTLIREMLEQMLYSGEYAERMENIRQMWQDILTGEDTAHTADDVVKEIKQLESDMAQDTNMSSLVSEWKDLNIELGKAKEGFSDLRSTIVNSLTSAKDTMEDFGKSLGKSMMTQMLDAYIDSNYKDEITALSQEWGEALASGNTKAVNEIQQKVINLYKTIGDEDIEVKNLTDAIREIDRVLDSTFKDMTDSWVSALSSMETTAEQFAQDVGKTMAQKIISEMVAPMYIQPLLDSMQDAYNSAMDVQGASVESVINTMSPYLEQVKIVYNEIQPMVEGIFGGFGIYKEAAEEAADEVEYRLGDLKSNFSSALMDMENSAADFSKEISKVLAQNFIEDFVLGDRFDQQMEYWKQQYESIIGSGMSEDERKRQLRALRDSIATAKEGYVNSAMAIQELLGITTEDNQEATMNMADKITYDQADQLLGINLAQELTLEQILATLQGNPTASVHGYYGANEDLQRQVDVSLNGLSNVNKAGNENMLIQLVTANSHLQLIRDYSKTIRDEVLLHLGSMDAKLSHLRTL